MSIKKLDDGTYAISAGGCDFDGCYESERAARFAFKIDDNAKAVLWDAAIDTGNGVISWQDIKHYRDRANNGY
jgi:hypothetical protein